MKKPGSRRPGFAPGYGISKSPDGLLPWEWAVEQLERSRNYWICTTRPDGRPHAAPVWGLWRDDAVVFSTSPRSRKARNLDGNAALTIHLESGDEVVILEGEVEPAMLDDPIADAYEAKYDYRPDPAGGSDGWYALRPRVAYAWLERDYPNTATRYEWD